MRCANLLPPLAIIAGAACLLAAAHGAVPVPLPWMEVPVQPTSRSACETLPHGAEPAGVAPRPAMTRVCVVPRDRAEPEREAMSR